jgi:hypothetical protein
VVQVGMRSWVLAVPLLAIAGSFWIACAGATSSPDAASSSQDASAGDSSIADSAGDSGFGGQYPALCAFDGSPPQITWIDGGQPLPTASAYTLVCSCASAQHDCELDGASHCSLEFGQVDAAASCGNSDPFADSPYEGHEVSIVCNENFCDCAMDGVTVYGCSRSWTGLGLEICGSCCFASLPGYGPCIARQ